MNHTKHIWRMGLMVFFALVGFVLVRMLLIPKSFGDYGSYRGQNIEEQMALEPQHGEVQSCNTCHDDKVEKLFSGKHKNVACENCHAPITTHIDMAEEERIAEMHANKSGNWCIRCHLELPARPKSQPQIDPPTHLKKVGVEQVGRDWSDQVCFECHNPHDPQVDAPAGLEPKPGAGSEGEE